MVFGVVWAVQGSSAVFVQSASLVGFATVVFGGGVVVGVRVPAVGPDVVALELGGLVAEGEGAGEAGGFVRGRVGVVVVAVVGVIREGDFPLMLGLAEGGRARETCIVVLSVLAGASARVVEVRHCWWPW